jgi:hypothetical protein
MFTKVNDKVMLSDTPYSLGKKLVQIWIPAISTLYFTLGNIWGFPKVEEVIGTLAAIATFLGVCLGLSSKQYDASGAGVAGDIVITTNPETGKKKFSLNLNSDPEDLTPGASLTFKTVPDPSN